MLMKIEFLKSFPNQKDACAAFRVEHPERHSEALLRRDGSLSVSCLHLYVVGNESKWGNITLDNENIIIETNKDETTGNRNYEAIMKRPCSYRLIFVDRAKGGKYEFLGLYQLDTTLSSELKALTWRRIANEVDTESILEHAEKDLLTIKPSSL